MSLPTPTIHVLVTALRKEIPSILPGTSTLALSFLQLRPSSAICLVLEITHSFSQRQHQTIRT